MLPAVEKALQELDGLISPETVDTVRTCATHVSQALERGALAPLKKALLELDEATQTVATLLIEKAMQG